MNIGSPINPHPVTKQQRGVMLAIHDPERHTLTIPGPKSGHNTVFGGVTVKLAKLVKSHPLGIAVAIAHYGLKGKQVPA